MGPSEANRTDERTALLLELRIGEIARGAVSQRIPVLTGVLKRRAYTSPVAAVDKKAKINYAKAQIPPALVPSRPIIRACMLYEPVPISGLGRRGSARELSDVGGLAATERGELLTM
ncbi:hypothetical protein SPRG_15702 [Saprolegnia parasitica CBS 223.65]|uniref:Uncharacterized protein n=1 Tax=Saprolegnia parasitica (strain CBS 223.65) TaxID=695850 RepID=A0A067BK86_SAPPC|nr:hypothetical protein SPRG_15702 [Saprolegnia parasitica CBS 223.65]KDO18874.1 hypothetical protein SPRG_15702 [Saprolegnia parasitica CBS 223.65]|eukprot:XP_012210428.1 hypothetical protein SPRG_15702 [Saprolegnia parasitica CBS 223.65]